MRNGSIGIVTFSSEGARVALRIQQCLPDIHLFLHEQLSSFTIPCEHFAKASQVMDREFGNYACWLFIAPSGVAVRSIAPHIQSKLSDPAVLVVDVGARHVVSLLSGHEGGANEFAVLISNILGADPVITTTTEVAKTWIAGIGCRKGISRQAIQDALSVALENMGITLYDLRFLATADIKKNEEGLLEFSRDSGIPLRYFPDFLMQEMEGLLGSRAFVQEHVGLPGVAEPAALLGGVRTKICLNRISHNGVTVALAKENCWWWESDPEAVKIEPTGQ